MRVEDVCICVLKGLIQSRELRAIVCGNRAQTVTPLKLDFSVTQTPQSPSLGRRSVGEVGNESSAQSG